MEWLTGIDLERGLVRRAAPRLKPTAGTSDVGRVTRFESLWIRLWVRLAVQRGQTLAEYGILVAVIAVIVIVAAITLGASLSGLFSGSAHKV
jgi:Flp pilus assembly pilin Flp